MVLARRQARIIITQLNNLNLYQPSHMVSPVANYLLSPFEDNINHGDPYRIKLYIQEKYYIDKEAGNFDILVSYFKGILELSELDCTVPGY